MVFFVSFKRSVNSNSNAINVTQIQIIFGVVNTLTIRSTHEFSSFFFFFCHKEKVDEWVRKGKERKISMRIDGVKD